MMSEAHGRVEVPLRGHLSPWFFDFVQNVVGGVHHGHNPTQGEMSRYNFTKRLPFHPDTKLPYASDSLPKINFKKLQVKQDQREEQPCAMEINLAVQCMTDDPKVDNIKCATEFDNMRKCVQAYHAKVKNQPKHKNSVTYDIHRLARKLGYRF